MAEGEFALVKQHLEAALARPVISPSYIDPAADHDLYALLADIAVRERDVAALRKYAPLAEEAAARYGHVLYQAIAHRAWGVAHRQAGEHGEAETRLGQALALFEELETRWQTGRTLYELGELALARANSAAAHDYFSRALAAFEELRAKPDAAQARDALHGLP